MTTAPLSNDARAIEELRSKLGGRLTIVGHHYEQEATIQHCDIRGDSLELARRVPGIASDYIVFCGVYFMAESAALLAREGQQVLLPDHSADCVMAQMTPARLLDRVLGRLTGPQAGPARLRQHFAGGQGRGGALRRRGVHVGQRGKNDELGLPPG